MNLTGKVLEVKKNLFTNKTNIYLEINQPIDDEMKSLENLELVDVRLKKYRKHRSIDANHLLWHCLGEIAKELQADKWEVYLQMLRRYGKFTYICVKPSAVEALKEQWRECEVIGEVDIHGEKSIQMLCYFGSSTYDSKEFAILLDGVISEMKEMELPIPASHIMEKAIADWERTYGRVH